MDLSLTLEFAVPVVITLAAVGPVLWSSLGQSASMSYVHFLVPDKGGKWLHLFGPTGYTADRRWHHVVLDPLTRTFKGGSEAEGENLTLDSPFVGEALGQASTAVGTDLELGNRSSNLPQFVERKRPSATERPQPTPDDAVVFWDMGEHPDRFDLELREGGQSIGRFSLPGDPHLQKVIRWPDAQGQYIVAAYLRERGARVGAGLAVLDLQSGQILSDGFVPCRGKK